MKKWFPSFLILILSRPVVATGPNQVCRTVSAADSSRTYYQGNGIYHGVYDKALALLPMAQELRGRIVHHLKPMPQGGNHLDLGCGTGRIGLATLDKYPQTNLHGVDFSPDMAKVAVSNGYPEANVVAGNEIGNLQKTDWAKKFPDGHFDNVTMNMVAYMLSKEELQQLFYQVTPKLKPGGRFVMTVLGEGEDGEAVLRRLGAEWRAVPEISPDEYEKLMTANTDLVAKAQRHNVNEVARMGELAGLSFHYEWVEGAYGGFTKVLVFEKKARVASN